MKLILIFGPQAVGKMSVGLELTERTELKLFHNHMTIELVTPLFRYGTPAGNRLVRLFRQEIMEEAAKSDMYGLIFTYVWAFDSQADWNYVEEVCRIFESRGQEVYFVELEAELETRLDRNRTPLRLERKPSKRNVEWSERDLLGSSEKHRLNSVEGEITRENYIKINNTHLSAGEVADLIIERFQLDRKNNGMN